MTDLLCLRQNWLFHSLWNLCLIVLQLVGVAPLVLHPVLLLDFCKFILFVSGLYNLQRVAILLYQILHIRSLLKLLQALRLDQALSNILEALRHISFVSDACCLSRYIIIIAFLLVNVSQ
jgi:hypothetical protein